MPDRSSREPEPLLAQSAYVRSLARELVLDAQLAQDVEQEVWLAALEHAPRDSGALRGWLAALVRNFARKAWRSRGRRLERERACAKREDAVPSPQEILEREDLRRHLIGELLALDEPYRSALILRFLEELTPREVARRLGLPVETARTRIKRGLELLRGRLDKNEGRAAWCLALVRGFHVPADIGRVLALSLGGSLPGVVLMSLTKKAALAAVAVIALVLGGRSLLERDEHVSQVAAAAEQPLPDRTDELAAPARLASARETAEPRTAVAEPAPVPVAATATEGSVLLRTFWHDGTPAPDIAATIHWSAAEDYYADAFEVRTGPDGTYRIEHMAPCFVSAWLDRGAVEGVQVKVGEEVELAVAIEHGCDVEGIVVESDGRPVAGAEIFADNSGQGWTGHRVARSGPDGRFFIRSLADGLCWLSARAELHAPTPRAVIVAGAGATLDVRLVFVSPGGALEGTVLDEAGQEIPAAQLLVGEENAFRHVKLPDGSDAMSPTAQRVDADEDGRFQLPGAPAGVQPVQVRARGFAPWSGEVEILAGRMTALDIVLVPGARVEGVVSDAAGEPLPGVEIFTAGPASFIGRYTCSRADGTFAVRDLPSGDFELQAESEEAGGTSARLFGVPGEIVRWDPVLDGGLSLRGRVVAPGIDPALFVIRCESFEHGQIKDVRADAQGAFEFTGLKDVEYRIEVIAAGEYMFPVGSANGVRPGGEDVVIEVDPDLWPSIRLKGRVLDENGQPLAGVELVPMLETRTNSPLLTTATDGSFDLGPYPAGRWSLLVRASGHEELRTEPVELGANQIWDFGDLRLR